MKNTKLHIAVSLVLIALTVGFIWTNSALSGDDSGALSGKVRDIMEKVLVFIHAPQGLTAFLLTNVRKVAHFVEYAVIGAELALFWSGIKWGVQGIWNAFSSVLAISVLDETIQLFATDRGPQITDVLLDTAGGTTAILIVYLCVLISISIYKSCPKRT